MKWTAVAAMVVALGALAACTDGEKARPVDSAKKAPAGATPREEIARTITSDYAGFGCAWTIGFNGRPVSELSEEVVRCNRMASGKAFYVQVNGQMSSSSDVTPGEAIAIRVAGTGVEQTVVVPFAKAPDGTIRFRATTTELMVVPKKRTVEATIDPLECRSKSGESFDCTLGSAIVMILSNR